jgi:hypothetical protein
MSRKPDVIVLMHGHGEVEILVPVLKRLRDHANFVIDARQAEPKIMAELGRVESLRGGRPGSLDSESLEERLCRVRDRKPAGILTGLHSREQLRVAEWAAEVGLPCAGLVEMTLPSTRHRTDQPNSRISETLRSVSHILAPDALVPRLKRVFQTKPLINYGTPEPWNDWIRRTRNGWEFDGADSAAISESLKGANCFLGQYHDGNLRVLQRICDAARAQRFLFLSHPKDVPDQRVLSLPDNCDEIPREPHAMRVGALRQATRVITEYSNLGFSVALTGKPVSYVFEDPSDAADPMVHLAVELGRVEKLPVRHVKPEEAALTPEVAGPAPPNLGGLDLEPLMRFLES